MDRWTFGLLLVAVVVAGALGSAQPRSVQIGAGATNCGRWLQLRQDRDEVLVGMVQSWLQGYLQGFERAAQVVTAREGRPPCRYGRPEHEQLSAWLDRYCGDHPLRDVDDGAGRLALELLRP